MDDHGSNNEENNEDSDGGNVSLSTTTKKSTTVTSRIAFGSCHKGEKSATPPIWDTILPPLDTTEEKNSTSTSRSTHHPKLDAWLWLGDAMYPSHRDPITHKKYYGPASPEEVEAGLRSMKHENATIGYKDFLHRLQANANSENQNENSNPNASNEGKHHHHRPLVTGVWDDHDFGGNDMGSGMPSKHKRRAIYRNFLGHSSNAEDRKPWSNYNNNNDNVNNNDDQKDSSSHEGLYHRVDLEGGRIRILVLDTRWFREDHCIPSVAHSIPKGNAVACLTRWMTSGLLLHKYAWLWGRDGCEHAKVLGDNQWAWLENELLVDSVPSSSSSSTKGEESPELFVILSSIQVWSTNPLMEGWGHFPKEQERMWNLLRKHYNVSTPNDSESKILPPAPVLFLSGDVHHAEITGQPGYYEVTSSGLTHHCGQHKLYGPVCEPILRTFTGHRHGIPSTSSGSDGNVNNNSNDNGYYIGVNYGVLEILDEKQEDGVAWKRSVRASIRNTTGHSVLEVVQPLAGHGPVPILPSYDQHAHTWDGHLIPYVQGLSLLAVIGLASVLLLRWRQ